jgi:cellulose synthase/poly-beta-1,6-N-acetylglucosamine synthase-like glycosyltransferase
MLVLILKILFFASSGLILYVYFGYPLLLAVASRFMRKPVRRAEIEPMVSILVAAYNEAKVIERKLINALSLEYPEHLIEIVLISDGSDDGTVEIANRFTDDRLKVLDLPRAGKINALNQGARVARGEIFVFTDANAILEPNAVKILVSNFADPEVGGVCGNQRHKGANESGVGAGENLYWKYDKLIKRLESEVGSAVAADGSLYAIRSGLYEPLSDLAQADDHAISSRVVTSGYRLVFDERAVAYEEPPEEGQREFRRKIRIANHTSASILNLPRAFDPRVTGWYALKLISHKVLRYFVPVLMTTALVANIFLIREGLIYQLAAAGQMLFYACGLLGFLFQRSWLGRLKMFYAPYYFCLANMAAFLGVVSRLRGQRLIAWQPRGDSPAISSRR